MNQGLYRFSGFYAGFPQHIGDRTSHRAQPCKAGSFCHLPGNMAGSNNLLCGGRAQSVRGNFPVAQAHHKHQPLLGQQAAQPGSGSLHIPGAVGTVLPNWFLLQGKVNALGLF